MSNSTKGAIAAGQTHLGTSHITWHAEISQPPHGEEPLKIRRRMFNYLVRI